jgi:hypothetical protein
MPRRRRLISVAIAALCTALPAAAQERDPDAFRATLARLEAFRKAEFVKAGAPSIDVVAASGRSVRRVLIRGVVPVRPPVMELERTASGDVFLSLLDSTGAARRMAVDRSAWAEVVAQDDAAFAEPRPAPPKPGPAPTTACHGDSVYFEAADHGKVRTAGGIDCPRAFTPLMPAQRAVMTMFGELALKALGCQPATGDIGMALSACLGNASGKADRLSAASS